MFEIYQYFVYVSSEAPVRVHICEGLYLLKIYMSDLIDRICVMYLLYVYGSLSKNGGICVLADFLTPSTSFLLLSCQ